MQEYTLEICNLQLFWSCGNMTTEDEVVYHKNELCTETTKIYATEYMYAYNHNFISLLLSEKA
jgi:hypothetical protein